MPIKNQTIASKALKFIQEICKLFQDKSLTYFFHDITFGKGEISLFMNDEKLLQFYQHYHPPAICTDESGRILPSGIYLDSVLREYYLDVDIIFHNIPICLGHSLHICKRNENYQELYSFCFDMSESDFLHWVLNEGNRFNDFIENYNIKAKDIINENMLPENRIVLPLSCHMINQYNSMKKPSQIKLFHKENRLAVVLAKQQSTCLLLLFEGKSIKQIANEMQLSDRTIGHYLYRIRQLLGCCSNRELFAAYGEQLFNIKSKSRLWLC